jgi:hypothetical protein
MTAMLVISFFAGCMVTGVVVTWYHKRPSKFDQWRKEQYSKYKDEADYD